MNIITGLQANSDLHIGNYFGAIQPMVASYLKMSDKDNFFYFVPNLHSFTSPIDHTKLYNNTLNNIKTLIVSGVDYNDPKVHLFRQSRVSEHAELAWALQCFTYYGEASRMTQFKDKSGKHDNFSVGLLTYPVLMAADILLYDCDYVPVGLDQQQHIELTRDIAIRFNNKFGDIFTPPKEWTKQLQYLNRTKGLKILSLADPTKKMSKSNNDPKGCVFMTDSPEEVVKKVMSASTDSLASIDYDPINQAGITNLLTVLACVRKVEVEVVTEEFKGQNRYGDFKKIVAQELSTCIQEFQTKFNKVTNQELESILEESEKKVKLIASKKLSKVYQVLGL